MIKSWFGVLSLITAKNRLHLPLYAVRRASVVVGITVDDLLMQDRPLSSPYMLRRLVCELSVGMEVERMDLDWRAWLMRYILGPLLQ